MSTSHFEKKEFSTKEFNFQSMGENACLLVETRIWT